MNIRLVIAASGLAIGASTFAQTLPLLGTYVSADGKYSFKIANADASDGRIRGAYSTSHSPVGVRSESGNIGKYAWVDDEQGNSGQAPFEIKFGGHWRPYGWSFVLRDDWNGAYLADNTILAAGTRTYVAQDGTVQVTNLGRQVFKLQ